MSSRFKALNLDSSEESEGENDAPTKEALEEKATADYMEALKHQGNKDWDRAQLIYQQLLESELLAKVSGRVTFVNGRIKPSLEHLKYCCYQNLGHVLVAKNQLDEGLELYKKALELDDTDLNLWYKIGLVGMKLVDLNVAISAFEEALEISPRHFPSLDQLMTATYAQGGLLSSLQYIARTLQYNPKYLKAKALKDRIFRDHPSIKEHYILFNPYPDYPLDPAEVSDIDTGKAEEWYQEVVCLRQSQAPVPRQPPPPADYSLPCRPSTWLQLSLLLSATHTQFSEEAPRLDMFRPVGLLSERQFSDVDMTVEGDQSADEEVDNINTDAANDTDDVEPTGIRGKRRRSSPTALEQFLSVKRRSTRVRNTARKEEPTLARTLSSLLPASLLLDNGKKDSEVVRWNDDSLDTMDMYRLFENNMSAETRELELTNRLTDNERAKCLKEEGYFGTEKEGNEVSQFLEEHTGSDILFLVDKLIHTLKFKWELHWPVTLSALFVQLYKIFLLHNPPVMSVPSLLHTEDDGMACVLFGELLLDQWLQHGKSQGNPSPLSGSWLGGEFPSLLLGDLHDLATRSADPVFYARTLWLHSMLSLYGDEASTAIHKLSLLESSGKMDQVNVRLVNLVNHFILNKDTVESMLATLNRKQMVDELADLYQQDDCDQIAAILTEVLQPSKLCVGLFQPSLDRDGQYSLLLYTLWRLDRINECLRWAEVFVSECVTQLLAAVAEENTELRAKWLTVINNTILCILTCIHHKGPQILSSLGEKLPRLVQSLNHVVCRQIETGLLTDEPFDIISPWMLLYEIISHCEDPSVLKAGTTAEERLPSSLRLLFTAHEYLGRREWCCLDEAVVLYQTLHELQTYIDLYHPESEEFLVIYQQLEQCIYCLYGHPMKRNRPRYVQEHSVNGLELTWLRSHQVLSLLRPKELPTYDSASKCSITADTETLLRRIIQLVPQQHNPGRLVEQMTKYIEGTVEEVPQNNNPLPPEMADIYYLIADHHFKNKTWSKAIRYYILDLCNTPDRVDAWACLALARGSILETQLNSCDALRSEQDFVRKALMSCRCYRTSLDLDSRLPTLWIEYGSFSYMIHSFCSRLLKQEQNLSLEMFEFLEKQKEEMIHAALRCFTNANKLWYTEDGQEMQDERWLHHYMLGKIAEKKQEPAQNYLSLYIKSMEFLHLNNAMYPDLVTYNTPQNLAVEALELYYRVHAVILKTLEQSEDRPLDSDLRKVFHDTLDKVASGPFACKVTRSEEAEGAINAIKTIYIDSEETRMAAVKRLMDSVLELVEADVEFDEGTKNESIKREGETIEQKPAKRIKREDSEASEKSKEEKKINKDVKKSWESSSDSESDSDSSSSDSTSSEYSESDDSTEEEEITEEKKGEMKKKTDEKDDMNWRKEQDGLTTRCLEALEDCAHRFPEHFKSRFRLAHFYFRSKHRRNVDKARQLLLGEDGLFFQRKHSNFFNGVWRIPSNEIDRPGSFAAHMSRCVLLLVDVLRHTKDHKMLFDLALRLKDTPESDKKYLRDPEREELSREALSLSVQVLRRKITDAKSPEDQKTVVLDAFKVYLRCSKQWEQKQSTFVTLLTDAYSQYKKEEGSNVLDAAVKFCTQELATQKTAATPATSYSSPDVSQASSPVQLAPPIPAQQKPPPTPNPPIKRGRGRPSMSSLRHQNPNAFKQARNSGELNQLYRDMITQMNQQAMNQTKTTQSTSQALLNPMMNQSQQMMLNNAAMAFSQQITLQTELYRQQMMLQQAQMQGIKTSKTTITSAPQQKVDSSASKNPLAVANSLLAPSKVSVFSSQSVLLPSTQSKPAPKSQSAVTLSASSNPSTSGGQPRYTQGRSTIHSTKQSPSTFQQKMEPKVSSYNSLQHKLLSAKISKNMSVTRVLGNKSQATNVEKTNQGKEKTAFTAAAALSSRGISTKDISVTPISVSKPQPTNVDRTIPGKEKTVSITATLSSRGVSTKTMPVTPISVTKPQITNVDRTNQGKEKIAMPAATALNSRGVSITPAKTVSITPAKTASVTTAKTISVTQAKPVPMISANPVLNIPVKPPEIKIPKEITLKHGLSISPVSSSRTKSPSSPSTSKDVTMTVMKSSSDLKSVKNGSLSVSVIDGKKSQLSPGGRNSPTTSIKVGNGITITTAKPDKTLPVKPIPKADFSITLSTNDS